MTLPLQITFRDMPPSTAIEDHIRKKTEKLMQFTDTIISCHIVVEVPQKHKHQGKIYNVRIDLNIPKAEIVVNHAKDEDIYVALRDAFNAAKRKLQEHHKLLRGHTKTHDSTLHGKVVRLFQDEGYGFIQTADDNEYYFHETNLGSQDFMTVTIGDEVDFIEAIAAEGLQANRVSINKH